MTKEERKEYNKAYRERTKQLRKTKRLKYKEQENTYSNKYYKINKERILKDLEEIRRCQGILPRKLQEELAYIDKYGENRDGVVCTIANPILSEGYYNEN